MLRGIRKASENWLGRAVMGVVMFLLAGSFAVWGINDIFKGFGRSTLAKIGDTEIPVELFRQTYNERVQSLSQQLGHPLPPDQATALGLDRQVLGEMVAQAGLDQRARQMRLGVADAEISRRIKSNPSLQNNQGQFDPQRFEQFLRSTGYTERRFVTEERRTMLRRQLIESVSGSLAPPKAWLDAINQFQNEERAIEYLTLGPAQAGDIAPPTPEQLSKYFDERRILFRAPEYRKIETVTVTPTELAKWMEISDADIQQAYDARKSRFTTPERRHIEQIVFLNMAEAQAAADRLKSGTSFIDIATEHGFKEQDIDLGTIAKSRIVDPAVGDAAFSLKEGEVSAPVQGQFGAVLVTALKVEPAVTKTLAEVAPALRTEIALERAKDQVQDIHDKIEDDRAGGASLAEATQKLKLPIVSYDAVDRSGRDPQNKPVVTLPRANDVIAAAFGSDVGVDNDPIDADGGYVWYDVLGVTPAHDRPLEEVKNEVEQRWRDDEVASRLKAKAADVLDKLKSGTPFDAAATANGVKLQTIGGLKRGGATSAITPKMGEAVFRIGKDSFGSAVGERPSEWIVFRVTDVKTPGLDAKSATAQDTEQTVRRQLSDDVIGQYVAWVETELGTDINPSVLAQALGNSSGNAPDTN